MTTVRLTRGDRCQTLEMELLEEQLRTEREYVNSLRQEYEAQHDETTTLELFRDFAEDYFEKTYDEVSFGRVFWRENSGGRFEF